MKAIAHAYVPDPTQLVLETIAIELVRTDGGTKLREIDTPTLERYGEAYEAKATMPAIVVFREDGQHDYWLADGFHRLEAQRLRGAEDVLVEIRCGALREAILFACGANHAHGRPRSNEDKRRAVMLLLEDKEWSRWNDSEIARRCNVSHSLVGKVRDNLTCNDSSERRYRNKHGGESVMNVSKLGGRRRARSPGPRQEEHSDDESERGAAVARDGAEPTAPRSSGRTGAPRCQVDHDGEARVGRQQPEGRAVDSQPEASDALADNMRSTAIGGCDAPRPGAGDDDRPEIVVRYRDEVAFVPVAELRDALRGRESGRLRLEFDFQAGGGTTLRISWCDETAALVEGGAP